MKSRIWRLFSLEKNVKVNVGPASVTKGFLKYDLKSDTLEQVIPLDLNALDPQRGSVW